MKNLTEVSCFIVFIYKITLFTRLYEEHFEKIKKINNLKNPNKIKNTFISFSKNGLTSI